MSYVYLIRLYNPDDDVWIDYPDFTLDSLKTQKRGGEGGFVDFVKKPYKLQKKEEQQKTEEEEKALLKKQREAEKARLKAYKERLKRPINGYVFEPV